MKSVLISVQPQWCVKIASRMKSVEVRKKAPKLETPFKVYIYCTSVKSLNLSDYVKLHRITGGALDDWSGKVIGGFTCDWILLDRARENADRLHHEGLIPYEQLLAYGTGKPLYGWHISDLVIYDEPKRLSDFHKCGALSPEDLDESLCRYCLETDFGDKRELHTPSGVWMCEGRWCDDAYNAYLDCEFTLTRPPQSWCYVEEV